jgi:flagellar basal body rod protein FlgG
MVAARTRLEIATENLANVSTDGFARIAARGSLTSHGVELVRIREPGVATHVESRGDPSGPHLNGVDAIAEMIDVLAAERSFESAQKVVAAIDQSRQKSADAARIE